MKTVNGASLVATGLLCAGIGSVCLAAEPATAPDKSQYTLVHPTPAGELRGMSTDRPNLANSPQTIDAGHLQVETGIIDYTYYRDRYKGANANLDLWSFGEFNFRLGVLNNLEVNAAFSSYYQLDAHSNYTGREYSYSGFGDTVLGGKLNFWGDDMSDRVWATALAIHLTLSSPWMSCCNMRVAIRPMRRLS